MRIKQLYATYDRISKVYGEMVWPAMNDEDAKRGFIGFIRGNQVENMEDYILVKVGEYDRVDGTVKGIEHGNEIIMKGIDVGRDNVVQLTEERSNENGGK